MGPEWNDERLCDRTGGRCRHGVWHPGLRRGISDSEIAENLAGGSAAVRQPSELFRSFWMGGFECSCHRNSEGCRLDMSAAVGHDIRAREDYELLRRAGIRTARDGVRWHLIERAGAYDFSSWQPMLEAARDAGVQVIWDLCHYGWPDDLDLFSPEFIERFARFCRAVARFHLQHTDDIPYFVPVNEINFFAWAACRDLIYPHACGRDHELKQQLVRASLAAVEAVRSEDRRARFVFPEPLIHTVPPRVNPALKGPALRQRESQFEAWDMMADRCLDILGVNFYASNQWEVPGGRKLDWDNGSRDERWVPLHLLLAEVYQRYQRPLFLSETSHYGAGRAAWLREIAREVQLARHAGVPLEGICLYPILDRFDWDDRGHWHNSGLFDLAGDTYERVLNAEYAEALRDAQQLLAAVGCQ